MIKLKRTERASTLQMVDVSNWQNDFIIDFSFGFKVQQDTLLYHGFCAINEVILWPIMLTVLNFIRLGKRTFCYRCI